MATYSDAQVKSIIKWKPVTLHQKRLHLCCLLMLDTGCRIGAALGVRVADFDWDNLLVKFTSKGQHQHLCPISFELRKAAYKLAQTMRSAEGATVSPDERVFDGMDNRNTFRDVVNLCRKLGFTPPRRTLHAFRHTFAVNYLRRGGSVFHLQKMLNHKSLEMSRRYANLSTADLSAVHERLSLLSR